MSENRKPLSDLVAYAEQIVDATGRLQDFRTVPFLYLLIKSDTGRSALHIRTHQTELLRTIELGEGWVHEPFRTIRMYADGLPVTLDDFYQQTPYRIERYARDWVRQLEEKGYLQQAALSYTAILSPESLIWCPQTKDAQISEQLDPVPERHYCRRLWATGRNTFTSAERATGGSERC